MNVQIHRVNDLDFGNDGIFVHRPAGDRQYHLAKRSRLRKFDKTPFRIEPVGRQDEDNGMASVYFIIELSLPVLAGADTGRLVEIEKYPLVAKALEQPLDLVGSSTIKIRMTDEDCRHTAPSNKSSSIAPRRRRLRGQPVER